MTLRIITKYSGGDDDDNAEFGNTNLGGKMTLLVADCQGIVSDSESSPHYR